MSHSAGFLVNSAEVAGIQTTYVLANKVFLTESAVDAKAAKMPSACHLSHLEIQVDETAVGPVATLSGYLTWDSTGDLPMGVQFSAAPVNAGLTDTSLRLAIVAVDRWVVAPTGQTTVGTCYLHIKADAGTFTVKKVRLVWTDRR